MKENKVVVVRQKKRISPGKLMLYLGLVLLAVVEFYPIFFVVVNSFKNIREFYLEPLGLPSQLSLDNIREALSEVDLLTGLKNNLIIVAGTLAIVVLCGALAGYSIARRPSKGKNSVYTYFLLGLILPSMTMMVPLAVMINKMGLLNSHLALILTYAGTAMPLSVMLYSGFMRTVPMELEEAAIIDGASMIKCFTKIYLPMLKTPTATIVIFESVAVWNDYLWPSLLLVDESKMTLMPMLYSFYGRQLGSGTRWDLIFPAILLMVLPVLVMFVMANKSFIKGLTDGALKG